MGGSYKLAATDASTPLRTLVGNDALFLAQLRRASDTYEAFEKAIRERLNWYSCFLGGRAHDNKTNN